MEGKNLKNQRREALENYGDSEEGVRRQGDRREMGRAKKTKDLDGQEWNGRDPVSGKRTHPDRCKQENELP